MKNKWTEHEIRNEVQKRTDEYKAAGRMYHDALFAAWVVVCMEMRSELTATIAEQARDLDLAIDAIKRANAVLTEQARDLDLAHNALSAFEAEIDRLRTELDVSTLLIARANDEINRQRAIGLGLFDKASQ